MSCDLPKPPTGQPEYRSKIAAERLCFRGTAVSILCQCLNILAAPLGNPPVVAQPKKHERYLLLVDGGHVMRTLREGACASCSPLPSTPTSCCVSVFRRWELKTRAGWNFMHRARRCLPLSAFGVVGACSCSSAPDRGAMLGFWGGVSVLRTFGDPNEEGEGGFTTHTNVS